MNTGAYQSFAEQTGNFAFQFDLTTANLNQLISAGISGLHPLLFTFQYGKIYDPNNYYVGSYQAGLKTIISGQMGPNSFDYYINNNLIAVGQPKQTGTMGYFYISTSTGNSVNYNAYIASYLPKYTLTNNILFIPGQNATGVIINNEPQNRFQLFSGLTFGPQYIYSGNTTGQIAAGSSGSFYINVPGAIQTASYSYPIRLNTNFGDIQYNLTLNAGTTGTGFYTNLSLFNGNFNGINGAIGTTNSNSSPLGFFSVSGVSYINTPILDVYLLTTGSGWDLTTGINSNGYGAIDFQLAGFTGTSGFKNPNVQTGISTSPIYITVNYTSNTGYNLQYANLVITGYNTGILIPITGGNT